MRRYSSLAAFLAHYDALRKLPPATIGAEDRNALAEIEKALAPLRSEERAALTDASRDPAAARHRERALLHLRRELIARGALDG